MLERREALLHDFLVRADTETPEFTDRNKYALNIGVVIGPAVITRDFIGSPIIRAHVDNERVTALSFMLQAQVTSSSGSQCGASAVVVLRPHEERSIELMCPDVLKPQSLSWSTVPL